MTPRFEHFLAQLYVDEHIRRRFMSDPRATAMAAGLGADEIEALERVDRTGLELAAHSYALKRQSNPRVERGQFGKFAAFLRRFRLR
jgi:hypothetical protein